MAAYMEPCHAALVHVQPYEHTGPVLCANLLGNTPAAQQARSPAVLPATMRAARSAARQGAGTRARAGAELWSPGGVQPIAGAARRIAAGPALLLECRLQACRSPAGSPLTEGDASHDYHLLRC